MAEKPAPGNGPPIEEKAGPSTPYAYPEEVNDEPEEGKQKPLKRALEGRHMQMIAVVSDTLQVLHDIPRFNSLQKH